MSLFNAHTMISVILAMLSMTSFAKPNAYVFVSFSMPNELLVETLKDSSRLHIPALLNGLYHNSMSETAKQIMQLTKEIPSLQLQIDPNAFERFAIRNVPALVVKHENCFDVIYGNLPLAEGLSRIAQKGACLPQDASS